MLVTLIAVRAEESFSKAIRPEDFRAAELDKLSPEALARLDGLVQAYKSGAVAMARAEAEERAAAAERMAREQQREQEKAAKASTPGFFAKAKVMLTPGTDVEYADIESRIAGDFQGWDGHTIFTLENGQHWKVANGGGYYSPTIANPKVKISAAALGGFWLKVEGVNQRVKVVPLTK
ncbi:MAG: hypothetical protein JWM35_972 [Verrucomicrobia bacterium]|nr:hypothetical protein [Verrucomicrobiota bacterium]